MTSYIPFIASIEAKSSSSDDYMSNDGYVLLKDKCLSSHTNDCFGNIGAKFSQRENDCLSIRSVAPLRYKNSELQARAKNYKFVNREPFEF
jgi:hypothetical protein